MGLVSGRGAKNNKRDRVAIHYGCCVSEGHDPSGRSRSGNDPMSTVRYDIIYHFAWWLCVITLPWTIQLSSISIILLGAVWLAEGKWRTKWQRLKSTSWVVPFFVFFGIHLLGLLYSEDLHSGLFEIEKKLTFAVFPLIAASGK